jgi:hypothetical protein
MFFKRTVKEYIPYEKSVTVTEKRAPADESVKLLKELELAAEAKLLERIPLKSNLFEGEIHIARDFANDGFIIKAIARINGELISDEIGVREWNEETATKLRDSFAKKLASQALSEPFKIALLRTTRINQLV